MNIKLEEYIKSQLASGVTRGQITSSLVANGWSLQDINNVFIRLTIPGSKLDQKPARKIAPIIIITILILVIILSGTAYYFLSYKKTNNSTVIQTTSPSPTVSITTPASVDPSLFDKITIKNRAGDTDIIDLTKPIAWIYETYLPDNKGSAFSLYASQTEKTKINSSANNGRAIIGDVIVGYEYPGIIDSEITASKEEGKTPLIKIDEIKFDNGAFTCSKATTDKIVVRCYIKYTDAPGSPVTDFRADTTPITLPSYLLVQLFTNDQQFETDFAILQYLVSNSKILSANI